MWLFVGISGYEFGTFISVECVDHNFNFSLHNFETLPGPCSNNSMLPTIYRYLASMLNWSPAVVSSHLDVKSLILFKHYVAIHRLIAMLVLGELITAWIDALDALLIFRKRLLVRYKSGKSVPFVPFVAQIAAGSVLGSYDLQFNSKSINKCLF